MEEPATNRFVCPLTIEGVIVEHPSILIKRLGVIDDVF
jgi:hypothetical protein